MFYVWHAVAMRVTFAFRYTILGLSIFCPHNNAKIIENVLENFDLLD